MLSSVLNLEVAAATAAPDLKVVSILDILKRLWLVGSSIYSSYWKTLIILEFLAIEGSTAARLLSICAMKLFKIK